MYMNINKAALYSIIPFLLIHIYMYYFTKSSKTYKSKCTMQRYMYYNTSFNQEKSSIYGDYM